MKTQAYSVDYARLAMRPPAVDDCLEKRGRFMEDLKVKIAWVLVAKVLGLTLLWFLFFRGAAP